jgi:hypothetical protein
MKSVFLLLSVMLFLGCNPSAQTNSPMRQRARVEQLVGGKEAYETITAPDKIEVWLLPSSWADGTFREKKDRKGPVVLEPETTTAFSKALLDFNSYYWDVAKACIADYGVRLHFTRGKDTVEFLLCYECAMLEVTYNGQTQSKDFNEHCYDKLVKATQAVFPEDQVLQNLKVESYQSK